jgi:hypothetical protein
MITYSTNWMGPISIDWFRERGLTEMVTLTVKSELQRDILRKSRPEIEIGDTFERETITTHYGGGRIDIRGLDTSEFYNGWGEYSLPIMHGEDYNALSDWLDEQEDETVRNYDELICDFEREYGKLIRWADDE